MIKKLNSPVNILDWVDRLLDDTSLVAVGLVAGLITGPDRPDLVTMAHEKGVLIISILLIVSFVFSYLLFEIKHSRQEALHDQKN